MNSRRAKESDCYTTGSDFSMKEDENPDGIEVEQDHERMGRGCSQARGQARGRTPGQEREDNGKEQEEGVEEDMSTLEITYLLCDTGKGTKFQSKIQFKMKLTKEELCWGIFSAPLFHQLVLNGNVLEVAMRYREDFLLLNV